MKKHGQDITPYEALDELLRALSISPSPTKTVTKEQLLKFVTDKNFIEVNANELTMLLEQLVEDGFVKAEIQHNSTEINYSLTLKGQMLNIKGGYKYFSRDQERLYKLEVAQMDTQKKLYYAIVILAIGAIIASVFYILRIFDIFHTGK